MRIINDRIHLSLGFAAFVTIAFVFYLSRWQFALPMISPRSLIPSFGSSICTARSQPLRVFMYDLESRFNLGMVDQALLALNLTVNESNLPRWPSNWGLRLQHSVEYWMMASMVWGGREEWREAVRVSDAATADVFFVPFFSSLSFESHGRNMTDLETEVDRKLQEDMVQFLRESKYWQKSKGLDHVIPMHHPNAFRFLREEINASILIVADFGRYPQSMARLSKDVVAPYTHVVDSIKKNENNPYESRTTLLYFKGRTVRKDEGYIRAKLEKMLVGEKDVVYEKSFVTEKNIKMASEEMKKSKFCLNLAGDTPSSCRLFDSIASHCIPVIISSKIELPFEAELDYTEFSFFFSVNHALQPKYMITQLRQVSKERYLQMWNKLKNISHHFEYQYPPKEEDAVNMIWRQVKSKINTLKLQEHRNRRLQIPDWWTQKRR